MEISVFCEKIELPHEAIENINWLQSLLLLDTSSARRLEIPIESENKVISSELEAVAGRLNLDIRIINLYFVVINAIKCKTSYEERSIADEIYWDTMKDITVWCINCHTFHGEWGMIQVGWLVNHLRLELYKLGRLQFRPVPSHEDIKTDKINVRIGEPIIEVHMPEGEKLDYSRCLQSFDMAMDFFNSNSSVFTCESWLLEPQLQSVLPENSNITLFQKLFTIYHVDKESRQMQERVFPYNNPEDTTSFEEKTVLQRAIKNKLLSGTVFGSGSGVYFKKSQK